MSKLDESVFISSDKYSSNFQPSPSRVEINIHIPVYAFVASAPLLKNIVLVILVPSILVNSAASGNLLPSANSIVSILSLLSKCIFTIFLGFVNPASSILLGWLELLMPGTTVALNIAICSPTLIFTSSR